MIHLCLRLCLYHSVQHREKRDNRILEHEKSEGNFGQGGRYAPWPNFHEFISAPAAEPKQVLEAMETVKKVEKLMKDRNPSSAPADKKNWPRGGRSTGFKGIFNLSGAIFKTPQQHTPTIYFQPSPYTRFFIRNFHFPSFES